MGEITKWGITENLEDFNLHLHLHDYIFFFNDHHKDGQLLDLYFREFIIKNKLCVEFYSSIKFFENCSEHLEMFRRKIFSLLQDLEFMFSQILSTILRVLITLKKMDNWEVELNRPYIVFGIQLWKIYKKLIDIRIAHQEMRYFVLSTC